MVMTSLNTRFRQRKLKKSKGEDMFRKLSNDLLDRILCELSTKDSVRASFLSKQWRNQWLSVPVLDLDSRNFEDEYDLFDFMNRFMESNKGDIKRFKLTYDAGDHCHDSFVSQIDDVLNRSVCHLMVVNQTDIDEALVRMPLSLYSCGTLMSLTLYYVAFDAPTSEEVVSLPSLKTMHLEEVKYDGDSVLGTLISGCLALEELILVTCPEDNLEVVCVRSESLKSFKLGTTRDGAEDPNVEIDSPKLEYMSIRDYTCKSFVIHRIGPFAKVNIDKFGAVHADNPLERTLFHGFLTGISTVREMIISARALDDVRIYSKFEPLPLFDNLSRLDVSFAEHNLELLPTFIGCCPNLQSLNMQFDCPPETREIKLSYVPQCFSSSLEFVQMKTPVTTIGPTIKMNLAVYFIRNCAVLKKLVVSKSFINIISKIRKIPKPSQGCEVVMLEPEVVSQKSSFVSGYVPQIDDSVPT